jgi:DNA-binding transcriptional ArsR family regulator
VARTPTGRTVALDDAAPVFEALASETARAILARLADSPAPASDVADAVDTSIQNAAYHLDRLADADLVRPVGTWYSAKGREMEVYAARPVTIVCAQETE